MMRMPSSSPTTTTHHTRYSILLLWRSQVQICHLYGDESTRAGQWCLIMLLHWRSRELSPTHVQVLPDEELGDAPDEELGEALQLGLTLVEELCDAPDEELGEVLELGEALQLGQALVEEHGDKPDGKLGEARGSYLVKGRYFLRP
nr:uncharacterized protein LOC123493438 [Aegilops tauschii subsp. strangulata]